MMIIWPCVAKPSESLAPDVAVIACIATPIYAWPGMEPWHFFCSLLFVLYLSLTARSAALTISLSPNERACFFADVDKPKEKIGVCSQLVHAVHCD